jgi:hypothetical protein
MMARPSLRPILNLRAVVRITVSLTGKTGPARSLASLYFGHPSIGSHAACVVLTLSLTTTFNGALVPQGIITF